MLNSSASAAMKGREWQAALSLFGHMPVIRVATDVISFNATISAYDTGICSPHFLSCVLVILDYTVCSLLSCVAPKP